MMKKNISIRSIVGQQVQGASPLQEDSLEVNSDKGFFILADGFGGSMGKAVAAIAVQSVKQFLEQEAGDLDATLPFELRPYYSLAGNVLFNAISFANHKVMQMNQGRNWIESGGASLIAGYLDGKLLAVANVGACSVFLKRENQSKELVTPKTLGKQRSPFEDSAEGCAVPLMSLGTTKQLEPEIYEVELKEADQLLFQSSGLPLATRNQLLQLNSSDEISQNFDSFSPTHNSSVIWVSF